MAEAINLVSSKKTTIIIAVTAVLLLVLCVAGYFYWAKVSQKIPFFGSEDITDNATKGVLPSINTNPLENKPDLNPADKANPYANIKTNPF